ncbi:MAG TPA: type II secretion system F family protein [Chloroflexota bacterium]|jgi:tight adherence protein C
MSGILIPIAAVGAAAPGLLSGPAMLAILSALGVLMAFVGVLSMRQPGLVAQRLGHAVPMARSLEEAELQSSFAERVLWPLVGACSRLVLRYTPVSAIERYRRKLVLAGSPGEVRDFLGIKGLTALTLTGVYVLLSGLMLRAPSPLILVALAGLGFQLPEFVLSRRIARRQKEVQRAMPDTLDLLTICVEAGLGFDGAIGRVVEKRNDELSHEFGRVLTEMRMGRSRRDALRSLTDRTEVQDVTTFVSAIVQSEQLGVPISRVLLTQAEQMRVRRRQRAEEQAHKAPIKMLFPMVFLIFPSMFVVILGPALPGIFKMLGS